MTLFQFHEMLRFRARCHDGFSLRKMYSFNIKDLKCRVYLGIMGNHMHRILKVEIIFSTIVLSKNTPRIKLQLREIKTLYSCIIYMQYINLVIASMSKMEI